MKLLRNPILPGFYPDPAVCKGEDGFYLVTSSFEYAPGVPIFYSKDFVHWEQIGHCLTRPSQFNLAGVAPSQGIYAPTIRYHGGLFYMITTLVKDPPYTGNINFYVVASNPAGPWSEPVVVKNAPGIDPTLFFEGDKAYYVGNLRPHPEEKSRRHIWLQELDLPTGQLLGERYILRKDGAVYGARAPEAPHIYKIGAYYYLLLAEGGTSYDHAVTVFRSKTLTGSYEVNPRNPVLTHRNMARSSSINSTGHADLIEVTPGDWWAVLLASRPVGGCYRNLGRETFAVPVLWEDEWPVFSPVSGQVEFTYPAPNLPVHRVRTLPACDHFDTATLSLCWNMLRTPKTPFYTLHERPGFLRLFPQCVSLATIGSPSFVGRRQQDIHFTASTVLEFSPTNREQAGIVVWQNNRNHFCLEASKGDAGLMLTTYTCNRGEKEILAKVSLPQTQVWLKVEGHEQEYCCYYAIQPEQWLPLGTGIDGRFLSSERAGGFTGVYLGLYAVTANDAERTPADFDWFAYSPAEE